MISKKVIEAIQTSLNRKQYEIAREAGLHYTTLSRMIHGVEKVERGDPRVLRLGIVLEIPEDQLFEDEATTEESQSLDSSSKEGARKIIDLFGWKDKSLMER
jgi:transcriptional regulator with XRE-family HTH domain